MIKGFVCPHCGEYRPDAKTLDTHFKVWHKRVSITDEDTPSS